MKIKQLALLSALCLLSFAAFAQKVSGKGTLKTDMVPFEATALHVYSLTCEPAANMKENKTWNPSMVKYCQGHFFDSITKLLFFIRIEEHNAVLTGTTKDEGLLAHKKQFYFLNDCITSAIKISALNANRVSCQDYDIMMATDYVILAVNKYVVSMEYFDTKGDPAAEANMEKYFASLKYTGK